MVRELHLRGFEKLRIVPSLSPSGLSWRCEFITGSKDHFTASNWISGFEKDIEEIRYTPKELADIFIRKNEDFLNECRGENKEYVEWDNTMLETLQDSELPYAFSDYSSPSDYWETSEGNKIITLQGEKDYYFNY